MEATEQVVFSNRLLGTMSIVYPVTSLFIHVLSFGRLAYFRMKGQRIAADNHLEINLFLVCMASLWIQIALMACVVCISAMKLKSDWQSLVLNLVSDISTLAEAYIGLIVNSHLRRRFIALYIRRFLTKDFLKGSFYRLYLYVLIVYYITYLNTYITFKFRDLTIFANIYLGIEKAFPPYRIFFMFYIGAFHCQSFALILLHLNRFTIVWLPLVHNRIWKPRIVNWICAISFLLGCSLAYQGFFAEDIYYIDAEGYPKQTPTVAKQIVFSNKLLNISAQVYPLTSLLIILLTFCRLAYYRLKGKRLSDDKRTEIKLFLVCVASLVIQLALMAFVLWVSLLKLTSTLQGIVLNVVSDFSTLGEAYIGLIFNAQLRKRFYSMYFERFFARAIRPKVAGEINEISLRTTRSQSNHR
ncbi:unnamed protein product, partial [Mesorhabditis spiculigera]